MVELWIVAPNCVGSIPIRHPNILAYPLTLIQSRNGNWSHGGSSPSASTMCYIDKLIKNNTGVSSKNFFLVAVTIIGLILLLVPAVLLIVEVIYNHTIATDLNGLAAYIGAVAAVFTSAGITKAWSEKYERKDSNTVKQNPPKMVKGEQ